MDVFVAASHLRQLRVWVPDTAAVPLFEAERPSPGTEKSGFFLAIRIS